ncbi:hypothetical protein HELRODRAFT_184344 [Helobdella robusta]|uniref:Uncharacterized protein n=1 Tax=Helobdella robusta TaxID=6412 RepID=T1FL12_HELRO|nr:hypothetical protein HELRODRAFT_184344 [Helobdella robusta]ESO00745.1 hypothetical protein HELRODRAFT_184344 [Helobdella robusta]
MIGTKLRASYPTVNGLMAWRVIVGRLLRRVFFERMLSCSEYFDGIEDDRACRSTVNGLMAWWGIVGRLLRRMFFLWRSCCPVVNKYDDPNPNPETDGDSDEEVRDEELTKQTTLLNFFHLTQEFIRDLNENEMEPEEDSSNYIPPTTRSAEQYRQISVDIVKHILPFQNANCNRENIKKDPHPLLESFMRRQNILNNACRNEEHCTCIRSFMEAYRIHKVSKPDVKKTKEKILIRPYCPTLMTIYQ